MGPMAAAAASLSTARRTTSHPTAASARTCATVASTSRVSVLVMLCTTTGLSPPVRTEPMRTSRVRLRSMVMNGP